MINRATGKSRCFGFVIMKSEKSSNSILDTGPHVIDEKIVDCKWALPPDELAPAPVCKSRKIFVGGLPYECSKEDFKEYFRHFGEIEDSIIMQDRSTGCPRGFGFVTFSQESSVEKVLSKYNAHYIKQKWVEVKIATPK